MSKAALGFATEILLVTTLIYGHCSKLDRDFPLNRQFPNNEFHSHGSTDAICRLSATGPQSNRDFIVNELYQGAFSTKTPLPSFGIFKEKTCV